MHFTSAHSNWIEPEMIKGDTYRLFSPDNILIPAGGSKVINLLFKVNGRSKYMVIGSSFLFNKGLIMQPAIFSDGDEVFLNFRNINSVPQNLGANYIFTNKSNVRIERWEPLGRIFSLN